MPAPAVSVKAALPGEEIEAPAVLAVERFHRLSGLAEQGLVLRRVLRFRGGEIRQQPKGEVFSLPAGDETQLLQPPGVTAAQQHRQHADALSRLRHPGAEIHARQGLRPDAAQQQSIQQPLDKGPDRHRQQQEQQRQLQIQGQNDADRHGQQEQRRPVQRPSALRRRGKEQKAHMAALFVGPIDQAAGQLLFLHTVPAGQLLQPFQIAAAGHPVHAGKAAVPLCGEDGGGDVRPLQQPRQIHAAQPPQGGEEGGHGVGERFGVGAGKELAAEPRRPLRQGALQRRGKEQKLPALQHGDGLKALQEDLTARLRELPVSRGEQGAAELRHQQPPPGTALPLGGTERAQRVRVDGLEQVVVVQQPLAGGGQMGLPAGPLLQQGAAAVDLLHVLFQRPCVGAAVRLPVGPQRPGAGDGVVVQPLVLDIGNEIHAVHGNLPKQKKTAGAEPAKQFFPCTGESMHDAFLTRKNT